MLQDVFFWAQYNNEALIKTLLSLEFEFISPNVRKVVFGVFSDLAIRYQFLTFKAYQNEIFLAYSHPLDIF